MMIRLLFTDIDGIFNSKSSRRATRRAGILPHAVRAFDTFIDVHDVQVVLTSEQRRYTSLAAMLDILGTTEPRRFIGITPVILGATKSTEIQQWLITNHIAIPDWPDATYNEKALPALWAILDDRSWLYSLPDTPRLVLVDARVGLRDVDLVRALTLLTPLTDTAAF